MDGANQHVTDTNGRIGSRAGTVAVAHRISWAERASLRAHWLCNSIAPCGVSPSSPTWATTTRRSGPWSSDPDRAGNMIEVIVLHFDDGREMAIHAMPMRSRYRGLLPRPQET